MTQLIIVAHAPLASALKAVATHAFPELAPAIVAIDVSGDEAPEGVTARLRACLPAGAPALILVDAKGATPCNAAQPLAREGEVSIVAGVNVRGKCCYFKGFDGVHLELIQPPPHRVAAFHAASTGHG